MNAGRRLAVMRDVVNNFEDFLDDDDDDDPVAIFIVAVVTAHGDVVKL